MSSRLPKLDAREVVPTGQRKCRQERRQRPPRPQPPKDPAPSPDVEDEAVLRFYGAISRPTIGLVGALATGHPTRRGGMRRTIFEEVGMPHMVEQLLPVRLSRGSV